MHACCYRYQCDHEIWSRKSSLKGYQTQSAYWINKEAAFWTQCYCQPDCGPCQMSLTRCILPRYEGGSCRQQFDPTSVCMCFCTCLYQKYTCASSLEPSVWDTTSAVIMGWCQRERRGIGGSRGRVGLWVSGGVWTGIPGKSVVIYLSHPSDSNSYTLRCLYILTLGLQGHNLKRYPVKNVEK